PHSSMISVWAARALSYAADASAVSDARMSRDFCFQQRSIAFRHQSAERLLTRIGLPSTTTKSGLVWLEGKMRRHTQLLLLTGAWKLTSCSVPSAVISFLSM